LSADARSISLARAAAEAASDVKATELIALDVSGKFPLADIFLIASGNNDRQVTAIAERIEERLLESGDKALRREGIREGRWALLDFNGLVVHVMHEEDRAYYQLERLWKDCPVVELPDTELPNAE